MILLNPKKYDCPCPDERSRELLQKTIAFFETKGKALLKEDDRNRVFYEDFIGFVGEERLFATVLTPAGEVASCSPAGQTGQTGEEAGGPKDGRWDTWRLAALAEILGFYGLAYWYTWQVSILGLGPIWMSGNQAMKARAAGLLEEGAIFAFGLSEKEHGADVYSTDMILSPQADGTYRANGRKYYIGNANKARMVSTFGKIDGTNEYVFFVADSQHERYELVKNVVNSQSYVAEYALRDYPVTDAEILHRGDDAWNAALNTVNIGKYNLGWASIGIATHAFYEAVDHASSRRLYGMLVTDFSHVKQMFLDAYARLVAMKLVALRAADYMRSASAEDRRYLLYNPVVKMKVTTQGEEVINLLWDVIAAKGFEKDMYFEMAARDIRALPKLEGTVHVNIALIVKFMASFFFNPAEYPAVGKRDQPGDDTFLFHQGPTRGLGKIRFHDYAPVFEASSLPNVKILTEQITVLKQLLMMATPDDAQKKDIDFLMALGEIFVIVVYGQLVLESAPLHGVGDDVVDRIFDCMVRDVSRHALELHGKPSSTEAQMDFCLKMIRKPASDAGRTERLWKDHVLSARGAYQMNP